MREYYHRHLPHWQPKGALFFVTFRLKDSLPNEVIKSLRAEREHQKLGLNKLSESERAKQDYLDEQRYFSKWDSMLDKKGIGPQWLSKPEIANVVKEAFHYRDGKVFDLYAFSIMPNHVHVVFEPLSKSGWQPDLSLNEIMHSLKRRTAREANLILEREGAFWQDESYDHVIRDNAEFLRVIVYVLENPVKAGLAKSWENWEWAYCKPDIL